MSFMSDNEDDSETPLTKTENYNEDDSQTPLTKTEDYNKWVQQRKKELRNKQVFTKPTKNPTIQNNRKPNNPTIQSDRKPNNPTIQSDKNMKLPQTINDLLENFHKNCNTKFDLTYYKLPETYYRGSIKNKFGNEKPISTFITDDEVYIFEYEKYLVFIADDPQDEKTLFCNAINKEEVNNIIFSTNLQQVVVGTYKLGLNVSWLLFGSIFVLYEAINRRMTTGTFNQTTGNDNSISDINIGDALLDVGQYVYNEFRKTPLAAWAAAVPPFAVGVLNNAMIAGFSNALFTYIAARGIQKAIMSKPRLLTDLEDKNLLFFLSENGKELLNNILQHPQETLAYWVWTNAPTIWTESEETIENMWKDQKFRAMCLNSLLRETSIMMNNENQTNGQLLNLLYQANPGNNTNYLKTVIANGKAMSEQNSTEYAIFSELEKEEKCLSFLFPDRMNNFFHPNVETKFYSKKFEKDLLTIARESSFLIDVASPGSIAIMAQRARSKFQLLTPYYANVYGAADVSYMEEILPLVGEIKPGDLLEMIYHSAVSPAINKNNVYKILHDLLQKVFFLKVNLGSITSACLLEVKTETIDDNFNTTFIDFKNNTSVTIEKNEEDDIITNGLLSVIIKDVREYNEKSMNARNYDRDEHLEKIFTFTNETITWLENSNDNITVDQKFLLVTGKNNCRTAENLIGENFQLWIDAKNYRDSIVMKHEKAKDFIIKFHDPQKAINKCIEKATSTSEYEDNLELKQSQGNVYVLKVQNIFTNQINENSFSDELFTKIKKARNAITELLTHANGPTKELLQSLFNLSDYKTEKDNIDKADKFIKEFERIPPNGEENTETPMSNFQNFINLLNQSDYLKVAKTMRNNIDTNNTKTLSKMQTFRNESFWIVFSLDVILITAISLHTLYILYIMYNNRTKKFLEKPKVQNFFNRKSNSNRSLLSNVKEFIYDIYS